MKKTPKKITISKAKKKAWAIFSKYVRRFFADKNGMVNCVTCPAVLPIKMMQAGHFIPGRNNSILYEIRGVHPQCFRCNIILQGNPRKYNAFMLARYGQKVIDELDALSNKPLTMMAWQHLEVFDTYNKKLKVIDELDKLDA